MDLRERFEEWVRAEVGSSATPALRHHLRVRDYRVYSTVVHAGRSQQEVYHPRRGFYRATGADEGEALLGILRQIWLVDSLTGSTAPEIGPAAHG